jgi:CYTH domain-containing protein
VNAVEAMHLALVEMIGDPRIRLQCVGMRVRRFNNDAVLTVKFQARDDYANEVTVRMALPWARQLYDQLGQLFRES